jgi:hypothetical protein
MASSYGRRCKYCQRWISMRQMPAGQWVAFENDKPHDCNAPGPQGKVRKASRVPPTATTHNPPEFADFDVGAQTSASPQSTQSQTPPPPPSEPPYRGQPRSSTGAIWKWIAIGVGISVFLKLLFQMRGR